MHKDGLRYGFGVLVAILLLPIIYSCASIGNPNGGPYDEAPPRFISSTPAPNQTNYKGKRVEIVFDELIQLERPSENVIITPPQRQNPSIRANARKVIVEFNDDLIDSTTYTLDFTSSIADNNEKNVLENYTFAFSTGDIIDTLEVSGILLNAENLEPMPGITIGLHSNLEDSAFTSEAFLRTTRTNDRGRFTIRNIAPGTYRIYALNDMNRDYKFDQPGEDIAFYEPYIIPSFEPASRMDTTWIDSLTIDTIQSVGYTHFLPDDIELFLFKEKFERQYMLRPERNQENMFTLRFNSTLDTIPHPIPVNFTPVEENWYYSQSAEEGKSVNFWLTDSTVWALDTLQMEVTYPLSDSLNILQPQTDTVQMIIRRTGSQRRQSRDREEDSEKIEFLSMNINASGTINIYDTIAVTFNEPVASLSAEVFQLSQMADSTWAPVDFELVKDSINTLRYFIKHTWNYGARYLLEVDSASIYNVYGKWNDAYSGEFSIKNQDEYGHLYLNITGINTPAFVEILNSQGVPIRKAKVADGGVLFMNLIPDTYYARLIVDTDENGVWDTGNYEEKRQPEKVYYSPRSFSVMQNWNVEETWDVTDTPIDRQKPLEITTNKPKEVTRQTRDYRNEGRSTSGSSGQTIGLPF